MGKNTDKLYITQSEWALGDHSAGGGKKNAAQSGVQKNPFWHCTIGQQPIDVKNMMCDKLGYVYDIKNIVPYIVKQGKKAGKKGVPHPVEQGATLARTDLLKLTVSVNGEGKIIDPVSFKEMSKYHNAVVVRPSKRVYLEDTIKELGKSGRDPVSDEPFTKTDVLRLRNCAEVEEGDGTVVKTGEAVATESDKPVDRTGQTTTHHVAASLTSTTYVPTTEVTVVEEDLVDRLKPKMPELKDPVYALLTINCQGKRGQLNLELYPYNAPLTVYNFVKLAQKGYYDGTVFHRNIKHFMIQGGDPSGTGSGGESIFGKTFRDECGTFNPHTHDSRGVLSMANRGKGTNSSQFFITYSRAPHLDAKHTVFGRVVDNSFLTTLELAETVDDKPVKAITLESVSVSKDPFTFLEGGLAKPARTTPMDDSPFMKKQTGESGKIGRYLKLSEPAEDASEDPSSSIAQKRKRITSLAQSNFSGW
ncbi:Peptidyl-prolyl cis-trans isomerase-like 2 [Yarrowia sp. B02]|nr:Peptidyl-prolyl cis-trans isomerase-like 2 [Yarrowia sp. B02]